MKSWTLGLFLLITTALETPQNLVDWLESTQNYDYTKYHPMDEIVDSYKTNEKLEQMLQNLNIYVTPVINVDGYIFTWTNDSIHLWRKSRSQPPPNVSVSFDNCAHTYCGESAGSEPEAQAVMDFVGRMVDQTLCFLTIHSAGQLILRPYGHPEISANTYIELFSVGQAAAVEMKKVHGINYTVGTYPQILYPNSGSSRDWDCLIGILFSYTFELRDKREFGHLLPEKQIQPACEEAYVGALSIITYVHDKALNNSTLPNSAVTTVKGFTMVSGIAMMIWSTIMTVFVTTGMMV